MLEDPRLDQRELADGMRAGYEVEATAFAFVPGYDMAAASYEVTAGIGRFFLKVRFGPSADAPLEVPRALLDAGVANVLAPMRTNNGDLWHPTSGDRTIVLYPFVAGRPAMDAGVTAGQWRAFGSALRQVHDSGLEHRFAERLPSESFALPSAAQVRTVMVQQESVGSPAGERLRELLRTRADRIGSMIQRAEELGARLRYRPFHRVLCHADIHGANVLVADDGRILMVDWDGPMLAPRERDLLFVIGSRIARAVEGHEEAWFFEGYGEIAVDREAIVYYRYERILEDIGEFGRSVFADATLTEASRESQVTLVESFFEPGGIVEAVERPAWR